MSGLIAIESELNSAIQEVRFSRNFYLINYDFQTNIFLND